jgi:uncharacterized protein (DUF1501 family)
MLSFQANRGVRSCDGYTRRDFLRAGTLACGLSLTELAGLERAAAAPRSRELSCIQIFLVGGPSHLDTWDLKPNAPDTIRGPFRPIQTNVPGIHIGEHFPRMARLVDRFSIIRSVYHEEAPVHETGLQLLQTGFLSRGQIERPHVGAVLAKLRGGRDGLPRWVVLPRPIGNTGVSVSHGQSAGFLGHKFDPAVLTPAQSGFEIALADPETPHGLDPARLSTETGLIDAVDAAQADLEPSLETADRATQHAASALLSRPAKRALNLAHEPVSVRDHYGRNTFGQSCLLARRLVEAGVRLVTVNMFDTVFNQITWDCHANGGDLNSTLDDYADTLCPMLDQAYSALLRDLEKRGLLGHTMVLCMGEFGRTPKLNNRGGRDHWPGVWSMLVAGGPIQGGRLIGASDPLGMEPAARPVHAAQIPATIYHYFGIDRRTHLPGPNGKPLPISTAEPLGELF